MSSELHRYATEDRESLRAQTLDVFRNCWQRFELIWALTRRDVLTKYRGSLLGVFWSLITPLFLLAVYTVVFGLIFKARWGGTGQGGWAEFSIMLFCGLIPFNFYNEAMIKACQIIVASPNYVKRIAFPTELLPLVMTLSSFVHAVISCLILMGAIVFLLDGFRWTFLLVPVVWLPLLISAWAFALVVSSVGVFIRDLGHLIGMAFNVLMFASPIFYNDSMVPRQMHFLLFVNTIAYAATNLRKVCVLGEMPNWTSWCLFMIVSLVGLVVAAAYFQRIRRRFADVL